MRAGNPERPGGWLNNREADFTVCHGARPARQQAGQATAVPGARGHCLLLSATDAAGRACLVASMIVDPGPDGSRQADVDRMEDVRREFDAQALRFEEAKARLRDRGGTEPPLMSIDAVPGFQADPALVLREWRLS